MLESHVEDAVVKWAEANGFVSRKMSYIGRRGCRDRDFYGHGAIVPVEFKRPGEDLRLSQVRERKRLAEHGVKIHVIDTIAAGIALLQSFVR